MSWQRGTWLISLTNSRSGLLTGMPEEAGREGSGMFKLMALMGMFCNALNDFLFRIVGSVEDPRKYRNLFYVLQAAVILILCAATMVLFKVPLAFNGIAFFYGVFLGVFSYFTYLLLILSLEAGDVSLNITLYRMNFVVASILAVIILQEQLTVNKILGVILLILAILIFSSNSRHTGQLINKGLKYSIAACFMASILNMMTKVALNSGINTYALLFYRFCTVFIIALATAIIRKAPWVPPGKLAIMSGISGILLFLAIMLIYVSLGSEEMIIVMPLSQMSFVITAVMSFVFLKEPLNGKKVAGISLAILCVLLIF
jgi:bacterial/archaeal transporter family protein